MAFVPPALRLGDEEQLSVAAVWACIRAIVDPIASSDVLVFTRDVSGGRAPLADDPIAYLLNVRPHPLFTAQAFKEIVLTDMLVEGDGFAEIVRDGAGRVAELMPLSARSMLPVFDMETEKLIFRYRAPGTGETIDYPAEDVLHVRGPSVRGLLGDSTVGKAVKAIALHVAQERFATDYFASGTHMGGIVKVPSGLGDKTRDRLTKEIQANFGAGGKKRRGVAFFEAGMEYQALGGNASETQIVPSRIFSVEEIARYFGVPLVRLGVQAAAQGYGTNVQQLNLQFVRDTLTPWCNRFTEEAEYKLFPQRGPWRHIEIETAWLTQGDDEQRARTNQINISSGLLSINEAREVERRNGIGPAGNLHLVPKTLTVLAEENLVPPAPTVAPPAGGDGGNGDGGDPGMDAAATSLLRAGIAVALENHRRRWTARTKDVAEDKFPGAREELRAKLAADLSEFDRYMTDEQFAELATLVESGIAPEEAASRFAHALAFPTPTGDAAQEGKE